MSEVDYSDIDRAFFERWPKRNYRMRRIYPNERATMEAVSVKEGRPFCPPPPGANPASVAPYVVVKQIKPGFRVRKFFAGPRGLDTDLISEEDARCAFEEGWIALEWAQIEAFLQRKKKPPSKHEEE